MAMDYTKIPKPRPDTSSLDAMNCWNSNMIATDTIIRDHHNFIMDNSCDGFLKLSNFSRRDLDTELDNSTNTLTLSESCIVYVKGRRLEIPKGIKIELGQATSDTVQKVYLDVTIKPKVDKEVYLASSGRQYELDNHIESVEYSFRVNGSAPSGSTSIQVFKIIRSESRPTGFTYMITCELLDYLDGEPSLAARLDRDLRLGAVIYDTVEG